ncbi:alpha-L-fucosidase [Stenotrophomonas acidaminiphila]|uniref:alpha-L-fucosidase n=1 Tax=Stenotrophomonas acidaminiphila TaxID=128780 RepID=UPI002898BE92|nr:alpha-L-fucosidase [Stenotrophomonas acidaminiphila]
MNPARASAAAIAALLCAALLAAGGCQHEPTPSVTGGTTAAAGDGTAQARLARWHALGYGMFVHWGLYSELGGQWQGRPVTQGYSEQIQGWAQIAPADYARVAGRFAAPAFDADAICTLARDAGARYIVVTAKHHDGFAMFDTASTDYNIVKRTPFGRDPLKLLSSACRRLGVGFGVYFSLVDWHAGHETEVRDNSNPIPPAMEPLIEQQLTELMTNYGPVTEVWFDMAAPTAAQSRRLAGIVRRLQPDAAINGRIWNNAGDFVTLGDNEAPPATMQPPFEVPASIYHATWGYRRWQLRDDLPGKLRELANGLAQARAAGGNYLLNIGPEGSGAIVPFEAAVLRGVGQWLRRHGNAALDARPGGLPPQPWGSTLADAGGLYLFVRDWRGGDLVVRGLASDPRAVRVAGGDTAPLAWRRQGDDVVIELPAQAPDPVLPVLRVDLDGPARIVPAGTVALSADGRASLPMRAWQPGTSFAFGSGYRTQRTTTVSLQAAVRTSTPRATAWLRFHGVQAPAQQRYRLRVGDQQREVDGATLRTQSIGPFVLPAAEAGATIIRVELAAPSYPAQDLDLHFDTASVAPRAELAP